MLEKEAALLEGTERSQIMGSKCKKIAARDKKAKGKQQEKYHGGAVVKIGVLTPVRGV